MNVHEYLISVSLYLRGDNLNPDYISEELSISPSSSQFKGEIRITKTNHEYLTKIGVWELTVDSDSCNLPEHINQLISKFDLVNITFQDIVGVQEAYIDVFISADAEDDGGGTCEFELSEENLVALARLGLPIRFTVALIKR